MWEDNMSFDWCHPDICLHKSRIHGQGHFAKKEILKDTIVFIFGGMPFFQNREELRAKSNQEKDLFYRSVIHLSDNFYLKAADSFHTPIKSRLINHSCDPNLIIEGHVVVRACRNILSGEELCLDYSTLCNPIDEHIIIERCFCKTALCRKQIASRDWKNPSLQKKYGVHFSFDLLKTMGKLDSSKA